jgi:5-methylthioribose kinase
MSDYYEFTMTSVADYAQRFLDGPAIGAEEIGDGNLNRVFRVRSAASSVVIKQALPYLKVAGVDWPLTRDRARIESTALAEHEKLAPGRLPQVLHFDEAQSAIVFEDLQNHQSWRDALMAGRHTPGVAEQVGRYCAAVLLGSSHLVQASRERKLLRSRFPYSDLCLVTEDLVFTAPYTDAASNRYDPEAADVVARIQRDRLLRTASAQLRFAFQTRDEALIHGDLHTGSILVAPGDTRVIDLEFAFFGPFGFDPGLLSAAGDEKFADIVGTYAQEFWSAFVDECRRMWNPAEPWYHRFISSVLADAARFAGVEMIRRIIGLAHVADIDTLAQPARLNAQHRVLACGQVLVVGQPCSTFDELWERATTEENFA